MADTRRGSPDRGRDAGADALRGGRWRRGFAWLAALSILALGVGWFAVMVWRTVYPFHLEWLESNVFLHAVRIGQGHGLYEAPLEGLISHPYPPLYYLVLAGAFQVSTPSLVTGRVISALAAVWSAGCCAWLARRRSPRGGIAAAVACAAWFALYPATGAWYELVRVDSLAVALWLQGVVLVYGTTRLGPRTALAVLCFAAASLTKQTCLPLAGAAWLLAPIARRPRVWFVGGIATLALTLDAYAWLDLQCGGWLGYYTITLPGGHETEPRHALTLIQGFGDLFAIWWPAPWEVAENLRATAAVETVVPALALTVGCALAAWTPARRDRLSLPLLAVATALVCSWSATKQGAYLNHFLPVAAFAAVGIGSAVAHAGSVDRSRGASIVRGANAVGLLAIVAWCAQDPRPHLPTAEDRRSGEAWVAWLRSVEGDVQMPALNYLPYLAGKAIHPNEMGYFEVYHDLRRTRTHEDALRALAEHPSVAALLEGRTTCVVDARLEASDTATPARHAVRIIGTLLDADLLPYTRIETRWPYPSTATFRGRTGDRLRPEDVYVRRAAGRDALPPLPQAPAGAPARVPR